MRRLSYGKDGCGSGHSRARVGRQDRKIVALAENPRPAGCKKLKGYKDQWRVRVGDWRVLDIIDDTSKRVSVTRIAHRREVYE